MLKQLWLFFSVTYDFKLHVSEREGKKRQQESICFKLHISGKKNIKNFLKNITFFVVFSRSKKNKRWYKTSWASVNH